MKGPFVDWFLFLCRRFLGLFLLDLEIAVAPDPGAVGYSID